MFFHLMTYPGNRGISVYRGLPYHGISVYRDLPYSFFNSYIVVYYIEVP